MMISSICTPNGSDLLSARLSEGSYFSFPMAMIACRVTPSFSTSCSCVRLWTACKIQIPASTADCRIPCQSDQKPVPSPLNVVLNLMKPAGLGRNAVRPAAVALISLTFAPTTAAGGAGSLPAPCIHLVENETILSMLVADANGVP